MLQRWRESRPSCCPSSMRGLYGEGDMPYKNPQKQSEYQCKFVKRKREKWFKINGPCIICGSSEGLQVDHIDPSEKVDHRVWFWSSGRRDIELEKCQVLCMECHKKKTHLQLAKVPPSEDLAWCGVCKDFIPREDFWKNRSRWNGVSSNCKLHRK